MDRVFHLKKEGQRGLLPAMQMLMKTPHTQVVAFTVEPGQEVPQHIHPSSDDRWIIEKGWEEARWMLERYHNLPMDNETVQRWCLLGSPEECIQTLQAYAEAGVKTVMFVIAARDQQAQVKLIAEEILPAFRE